MTDEKSIRIDKFLWSVRIYKTRSYASGECRKGRVLINNLQVKPSRQIFKDEIITVKKLPVVYTYRVIETVENRVSAKMVGNYLEDLTPGEEKQKLLMKSPGIFICRDKGSGRPTKKERRSIDRLIDNNNII